MQKALPKTQFKTQALTFHFRPFLRNCAGGGGRRGRVGGGGRGGIVPDAWLKSRAGEGRGSLGNGAKQGDG